MRIGFITLKQHTRMAGTEQVLTSIVSELEKKDIWTKGYFIHKPENQNFLKFFSNSYSTYMPKILKNKHILRPRILYKMVHRSGVERLFQQIESDNLDILFVLKIEEEFLKNHPLFLKLKHNKPNLKLVSWSHCSLAKIMNLEPDFKIKLQIFDAHFAISDGLAIQLKNFLGDAKIFTIYNPVAPPDYLVERKYNKFIYIGRIDKDKRVKELVGTLRDLKNDNWTLDIIGSTGSVEGDALFENLIRDYSLEDKITFHGWQDDPWAQVSSAGVLLLNSVTEGFALVLVEAMMRGIPCVSTDCPVGPSSIVQQGINGWLVNMNDDKQLKVLLDKILSNDLALPKSSDVVSSVKKFTTENVVKRFVDSMHELCRR